MACRGIHFALLPKDEDRILSSSNDKELMAVIEEIETQWDENWLQETDKAWDAIHRCLTDGRLTHRSSSTLSKCILGGKRLHRGYDYIVSYLSSVDVKEVATAINSIEKTYMRSRYYNLNPFSYDFPLSDEDFEYTWSWFELLCVFFRKAAQANRSIIFVVSQ